MAYPLTALATLACLIVYFFSAVQVARARARYGVKAPAVTGSEGFERTFRAQQNMLEWMPLFLPALWLFALVWSDRWAAVLGLAWTLARLGYVLTYAAEARKRTPYFLAQLLAFMALWAGAVAGVLRGLF
mgnify:CR=1 FL=1